MSVKIHNKEYITVNERLTEFREKYKGYSLISEIVSLNEDSCIIKATILDENGVVKATGHAQEDRASSTINKTSFVENCETSAWGRALGNLGIGIESSVASAEEVAMAIAKQEQEQTQELKPSIIIGGKYILNGGKYPGESIESVYEKDPAYITKLAMDARVPKVLKENIQKFTLEKGE